MLGSSVPGVAIHRVEKASVLSKRHGFAGDRTVALQCPTKTLSPAWGQSVGGVSGRAGAKAGGSNPFAIFFACRDGERHPGLPDGGALRGASLERRSRSVRKPTTVSPVDSERADDSGCPKVAEEGNAVGMRHKSACTRRRHERSSHAPGDASFTRSGGPCTSILTTHRRNNPRW